MAQTMRLSTRMCHLGMRMMKNTFKGSTAPKPSLFWPSREITAKTLIMMINNSQTVRFSHLLIMDHLWEIDATLAESAKIFSPQCPPGGDIWTSLPMSDAFNYRLLETWARNEKKLVGRDVSISLRMCVYYAPNYLGSLIKFWPDVFEKIFFKAVFEEKSTV